MKKKGSVRLAWFVLLTVFFVGTAAYSGEADEVTMAIQAKGAKWTAGETSVSVLPPQQQQKRLGLILPMLTGKEPVMPLLYKAYQLPTTIDWRNSGGNFVTGVRDQGNCGSCWAFATTAALESSTLIAAKSPGVDLNLSEQVMVSCSGAGNCEQGGTIDGASNFARDKGLPVESCYKYLATDGNCGSACPNWQSSAYKISKWSWVATTAPTVDALKNALVSGPLVTTMAVYNDFFSYKSGVYSHVSGGLAGYHAVLIVGYSDSGQYFIVKNSWGTYWGETGFFRIAYSELTSAVGFGQYTVSYAGNNPPPACSPTSGLYFSASGGSGTVKVSADSGCAWNADSDAAWITFPGGNTGTGTATVTYTVAANTTASARSGNLTIAGETYSVLQDGGAPDPCTYAISPTSSSLGASAGSGSVTLTTQSTCNWTASSGASWITITSAGSGTGNATIAYNVGQNTGASARTGTLTIAGKIFTVNQSAGSTTCTYSLSPTSNSFSPAGGKATVSLTTQSGCGWTATSGASWITITSGSSGTASGTVGYSVSPNSGSSSRTGTMTIGGKTFTVSENGSSSGSCQAHCGTKSAGSCYCDSLCTYYKDCCPDLQQYCPSLPGTKK